MEIEMIPLDRISISAFNVRADEPFGDEEDQALVDSIGSFGVLQPIIVKQVGDMYELTAGRRRLLSARESGLTEIPCIVKDIYDEEVMDISLIENIHRKNLDPVSRGRAVKRRLDSSGFGLGDYAKRIGIPKQTLSNWLLMTDLSPAMQNAVQSGNVSQRNALKILRMNLPQEVENTLAEEAQVEGYETFKKTFDRIVAEHEKRGAPKGLLIVRISWGQESPEYSALKQFAESDGIDLSKYCQKILTKHVQNRSRRRG